MPESKTQTPLPPAIPADITPEMSFYDSLGHELQQALCSNELEPMQDRVDRLKAVRKALTDVDDLAPLQAILMTQIFASHYTMMGCLKGAGKASRDSATAGRLRSNAATMMRGCAGAMRLLNQTQSAEPDQGKGARPWKR